MDRRLRVAVVAALVAVVALGIGVLLTNDGDDPVAVELGDADSSSTTTTSEPDGATTTSATADPDDPVSDDPTTTTTITNVTSSTTSPPAGGERRCAGIDAESSDRMSARVCLEGDASAGERTVIRITASDGNAPVRNDCGSPMVEWGDEDGAVCAIGCEPSRLPTGPSSIDIVRDHVYDEPGAYNLRVTIESNCGHGPFGERQTLNLQLVVR